MEKNLNNIESFSLCELTASESEQLNGGSVVYEIFHAAGQAIGWYIGICSYLGEPA